MLIDIATTRPVDSCRPDCLATFSVSRTDGPLSSLNFTFVDLCPDATLLVSG
jgi:hypothetical protein